MDLGAGYDPEDKRVAKAIEICNETLEPYLKSAKAFQKSSILTISGYGTRLGPRGQKRRFTDEEDSTNGHQPEEESPR